VSTAEQNTTVQFDAFLKAGVTNVFEEKRSAVRHRPVLETLLQRIGPGDILVVYKMDRLARSLVHLLSVLALLQQRGAAFRSLTEPIETETPVGRLFLQMLGSFAEFERALIRDRCIAGQVAARARGQRWGRPRTLNGDDELKVIEMYRSGWFTVSMIAEMLDVKRGAVRGPLCRAGLLSNKYLR
jgi:DNA invertase Pin-like site-specific DNA recombinase